VGWISDDSILVRLRVGCIAFDSIRVRLLVGWISSGIINSLAMGGMDFL
jgi:hypothetical protein